MPHTITYNPDLSIIKIKFEGNITLNETKEIFSESLQIANEQNCFLFLSDYREAIMKLSTFEIYELPKILSNVFVASKIPVHRLKRALVVAKDLEDYRFFEVVTANQGQNVKLFQDLDEAKKWLLSA